MGVVPVGQASPLPIEEKCSKCVMWVYVDRAEEFVQDVAGHWNGDEEGHNRTNYRPWAGWRWRKGCSPARRIGRNSIS